MNKFFIYSFVSFIVSANKSEKVAQRNLGKINFTEKIFCSVSDAVGN